jgi:ATP-dependent helicase/nuclease subunit A
MLVEAAAGTGKTTCLIARMVGVLREGKCRIETLAAVTFTRKAAAELRTRFQLALEKAASESSGEQRERLVVALNHVERCFIGTIHSFCARLLRERPVEAGVDPGFVELDDVLDAQLRQQAWREHVAKLITTDDPILPELEQLGLKVSASTRRSSSLATELDELGLEPAELGPAFLRYAEYSDVSDWPAQPRPLPDLKPCIQELSDYIAHMQSLSLPSNHGNDKLMPKYDLIGRMAKRFDLNQPAQLMELLEQFEGSASVVQKMWPGKKAQALAELDRWNDFVQQYAEPLLLAWREHRYEPVIRAIRPALDVYDRLRRERNGLNFQDLLLLSVALLRDKPEVRRYFRERFTHVLVDEFQDTDPIQAEVMLLLTADDHGETNWQQCRPEPGSLFVVGDPKQSIYRFRRADILTYSKVRSIIENVGGEVIPLTANFRSVKPVVEWVNDCFSNVFPAVADDFNPADRLLDVGRSDGAAEKSAIERLPAPTALRWNNPVAEHEADLIARTIRRAIDEKWPVSRTDGERAHGQPDHAQAGDFLIVARGKARLTVYARKLQQYGLPHSVTGGSVLNEVPELELLSTCLSAVARSDDPIALVAVLRSELFGVADTVLYDLRRHGGRFSYHSEIPAELPANDAAELRDAFERLQSYSRWLRRMPAAAAIERIAADLGLIARACAAEEGDAHAGSLLKSIELLRSVDGGLTVGDYVDVLARLVDRDDKHDGIPVRPPAEMPVRVMNLHQCKGLEAPFVFLVDPSGESDHDVDVHIDRSTDQPRGYLPIYGPKRSQWGRPPVLAHPPGWRQLAAQEQRFLDAETNRLLYVAATRAGVKLVISQRDGKANEKNPWRLFDDYLQTAGQFADPGTVPAKPAATITIDPAEWQDEVAAIEQRWQAVVAPTYAVQAIKASAIKGGPKPHGAEKGGAEWGQVLHTLLEAAMKQPKADLHGLALSALENEELPVSLVDEVVKTVERVISSEVWQRARKADRCLPEVPLAMPVSATESSNGLPTVLRGVIDLAFLESAGWVIVDYKSERVEASDIPALVAYYKPQIEAYVKAWEKVVGQTVAESGLFFTHAGKYVKF